MIHRARNWFKPAPAAPRRPPAEVEKRSPKFRWQVFAAAFMACAMCYVVRNDVAPGSRESGAARHWDKAMIGDSLAGTAPTHIPAREFSPQKIAVPGRN